MNYKHFIITRLNFRSFDKMTDKPYCLEIISERKLLNSFWGFPVLRALDLSDFHLEGLRVRNSFFDPYILKIHKMSWFKLLRSLRYRFKHHCRIERKRI